MPSFDIASEYDLQEVRNAIDQANREITTRFDFKGTESKVELLENAISTESSTEERLAAIVLVVEEKFVRRKVSLKTLQWQAIDQIGGNRYRRIAQLKSGISNDEARIINRTVKDLGIKGVQSQAQGNQIRVSGKKRDNLQEVIATLKTTELEIPLQFINFRD